MTRARERLVDSVRVSENDRQDCARDRGEARHPLDPRSYARPSFRLPPTTATDESRFQKRTRTPRPVLSYPSAIYDRARCTARNICPIRAKEKDKTALSGFTCENTYNELISIAYELINFTTTTLAARSRAFSEKTQSTVYTYLTIYICIYTAKSITFVPVSNSKTVRTVIHSYLHCAIRSYVRRFFATRNIRDQRFFPIPVNRNSIARPARKSTWIGSSILRPGSPGCVLMPREKGTEKVHLLRSIAPRFRNRARADLERFQRRADRALCRAIAETKRKERKKKKKK